MRRLPLVGSRPLSLLLALWGGTALPGGDWPQWRGPDGTGVSSETGLPVSWSDEEGSRKGIAWKCEIPEWGHSTPAIWGDAIFLTAEKDGALLLVKVSKKAKAIEWTRQVGSGKATHFTAITKHGDARRVQGFHATQNLASPSVVTDGERAIVHFGNGDLASYDFSGKQEWRRNLQEDHGIYTIWWGHANSPVLHGDLVISVCLQDSLTDLQEKPSPSYVVAHDKRTGKEVWKTMRMTGAVSEPCDAYTTPLFRRIAGASAPEARSAVAPASGVASGTAVPNGSGVAAGSGVEMIVVGGTWVDAYDPTTGKQLWCLKDVGGNRTITGPTLGEGLVGEAPGGETLLFFTVGMRGPVTALRLGKGGPGTKALLSEDDIVWRYEPSTPDSPSPVLWGDLLFIVNEGGFAACLDARTGKRCWKEKLKGDHRASPIAAEGRVYFLSTDGVATVIEAAREFRKVAESKIADATFASMAISDGRIYIRGRNALYAIERPPTEPSPARASVEGS